jgi:hypothetical protein
MTNSKITSNLSKFSTFSTFFSLPFCLFLGNQQKSERFSKKFLNKLIYRIFPKALFILLTLLGHVEALRAYNKIKKSIPHMLKKMLQRKRANFATNASF